MNRCNYRNEHGCTRSNFDAFNALNSQVNSPFGIGRCEIRIECETSLIPSTAVYDLSSRIFVFVHSRRAFMFIQTGLFKLKARVCSTPEEKMSGSWENRKVKIWRAIQNKNWMFCVKTKDTLRKHFFYSKLIS